MALRGEVVRRERRAAKAASSVRRDRQAGRKFRRSILPARTQLPQNKLREFALRLRIAALKKTLPAPTADRSLPAYGKVKSVSAKRLRRRRMRVASQKPAAPAPPRDARPARPRPRDQADRAPPQ